MLFTATTVVPHIRDCMTMEPKVPGDLLYILGTTRDELGASEYYDLFGYVGLNVPVVDSAAFLPLYRAMERAVREELMASCHGIYRGDRSALRHDGHWKRFRHAP